MRANNRLVKNKTKKTNKQTCRLVDTNGNTAHFQMLSEGTFPLCCINVPQLDILNGTAHACALLTLCRTGLSKNGVIRAEAGEALLQGRQFQRQNACFRERTFCGHHAGGAAGFPFKHCKMCVWVCGLSEKERYK